MKNNKTFEFIVLLLAVLITRLIDLVGTFHYTPNLSKELNPAVRMFGFGWRYLISIQLIGVIFSGAINYLSLFKIKPIEIQKRNLDFKEFISYLYFDKIVAWKWSFLFRKGLNGKNQELHMYGWLIPRILIYVGLVLAFFHILLTFVPAYVQIHKYFIIPMYLLMFSSMPVCWYNYYKFRFKIYNQNQVARNFILLILK